MMLKRTKILNLFFLVTFVLAGVSPACAFISGKADYIQICSEDGSLKKIKVTENADIYALVKALNKDKKNQTPQHQKQQDCGFCFANAKLDKTKTTESFLQASYVTQYLPVSIESKNFKSNNFINFQSRAPPSRL